MNLPTPKLSDERERIKLYFRAVGGCFGVTTLKILIILFDFEKSLIYFSFNELSQKSFSSKFFSSK